MPTITDVPVPVTAIVRTVIVPLVAELLLASRTVTATEPAATAVRRAELAVSVAIVATAVFEVDHVYGAVPPETVNVKVEPGPNKPVSGVIDGRVGVGGGAVTAVTVTVRDPVILSASVALTTV